jgi:hypothetical protein
MNARTATIAVVVALGLGGVTYVALRPGASPESPVAVVPSRLGGATSATSLTVSAGAETASATLDVDLDTWLIRATPEDAPWPAEPGSVRGALRLLSELARQPRRAAAKPDTNEFTTVTLAMPGQADVNVLFAGQSLGGKSRAFEYVEGASVECSAPAQTAELFRPGDLAGWRRADLLGAPGSLTEVRITSGAGTLAFKQVNGAWTLMLPVPAPVDSAPMKELLEATLPAKRLLSHGDSPSPGEPAATITRVSRIRTSAGGTEFVEVRVTIGSAADTGQETFHASATATRSAPSLKGEAVSARVAWGPVQAVVDGASVTAIARTPEYYVSKRAVQAPVADVTALRVLPAGGAFDLATPLRVPEDAVAPQWTRTLDGWTRGGARASADDAARVGLVIALLCDAPAARVHLQGLSTPVTPVCAVAVYGAAGGLADVVGVGTDTEGTTIYVRTGRVIREYTRDAAGEALHALRTLQ